MREVIGYEPYMTATNDDSFFNPNSRNISFVDAESDLPVPQLADENDPYTCKYIPVEGIGFRKNMFWCTNRVYEKFDSDETDQVEGFFMSGGRGRKTLLTIFMFKPSPKNGQEVIPWARLIISS